MTDILDKMKLDQEANQRNASSLERLADSFEMIAKLMAQFFDKMYPPPHEPRDVTLTRLPDTVDRIKQDQGATEESTDDWLSLEEEIGPREKEFITKSSANTKLREGGADKKASRPRPIKS